MICVSRDCKLSVFDNLPKERQEVEKKPAEHFIHTVINLSLEKFTKSKQTTILNPFFRILPQ